jgi:hypothetical protein
MARSPIEARDFICNCFFLAQKETFAAAGRSMGRETTDADLRLVIEQSVRGAFRRIGGSWDAPTREDLEMVVQELGQKALAFGTPMEVIQKHQGAVMAVLEELPRSA